MAKLTRAHLAILIDSLIVIQGAINTMIGALQQIYRESFGSEYHGNIPRQ